MKKIKLSAKTALVSGLVAASTAGIVYATPEILDSRNSDTTDNLKLVVEKVDNDTAKVSIDNIKEIPRSLQFSIKLDGAELQDGENSIRDLILKEIESIATYNEDQSNSNAILTDYTYNKDKNTIDVLITAENSIPKNADKVDVFEIDLKAKSNLIQTLEDIVSQNKTSAKYTITPGDEIEYKYVSDANKEYVSKKVDYSKEEIAMNTNPTISSDGRTIQLMEGAKIELTAENLGITMNDDDQDDTVSLEVKYKGNVITEFSETTPGVYNLEAVAKDSYGDTSETLTIQVGIIEERFTTGPVITKGDKELQDITLSAGDIFNPMEGVKATDAKGNDLKVDLSVNQDLDLDPETTTKYELTYTAIDKFENKTEKTITLTVNANKAPVILGVKDHNLMVGDNFDPREGVTVEDEDDNIQLQVDSNVSVNIPGEYKVSYSATDSKGKIARAQSKVVVISNEPETEPETKPETKPEPEVNNAPEIYATDKVIEVGTTFNPLEGVTATDKEDGTITDRIEVTENTVNINEAGEYKVTYSVKDNNGSITTKTITVTVKAKINLVESITINDKFSKMYLENEKTVTAYVNESADVKDVNWSTSNSDVAEIVVSGNSAKIIAKSEGEATITASSKDGSNKSDSFTINVVDFKNDSEMPSYIKDIVDTSILLPVMGNGDGSVNSPIEFEVRDITVDKLNEFLNSINNLKPVVKDVYSKGDFTVYKLKLTQEVGLLDKLRNIRAIGLFNSNVDIYMEMKVNNNLSNASELKARLNKLKPTSNNNKPNKGLTWVKKPDNTWQLLNNGKVVSGWTLYKDKWYFTNESGIMQTGWQLVNNKWYYLNADGDMATGWKLVNNKWYYLNADGDMATGWKLVNNKWYYLNSDGDMATSWKLVNNKWYYLNTDGDMATGWKLVNNKWYYLNSDGDMATGWKIVNNKWYYLNADGDMATGWKLVNNKWYYLNSDGDMATGWKFVNNKWYYLNAEGDMATGWKLVNNKWYYLNPNGDMAYNTVIDGYKLGSDGAWIK